MMLVRKLNLWIYNALSSTSHYLKAKAAYRLALTVRFSLKKKSVFCWQSQLYLQNAGQSIMVVL